MAKSSGQRVTRIRSLRTSVTVSNPTSGRNRPKASNVVRPASRRARAVSTRFAGAPLAISDLLDIRPAEQSLRQEYQGDREDGKGGNVFIVDGKICGPHGLDEADQDAADNRARQGTDAAKDCGSEGLYPRHKAIGKADHAIVHQVHRASDGGERGCNDKGH